METKRTVRYVVIAVVLLLGVGWSLVSARPEIQEPADYPNSRYLVSAEWLLEHLDDPRLVVVDVREDKYYGGEVIPGAVRLPWGDFRHDNRGLGIGSAFIGTDKAQEILGRHGIARNSTVVLYDSVERDGGATASYVFWVLDLLGHEDMKVLERGIEGWIDAGGEVASEPRKPESLLYQAPSGEIRMRRHTEGDFIRSRLGDPYYQVLDVRSREEYLGEAANLGLDGTELKRGHIPTAVNVNYELNWTDPESKKMKSYPELQELYRGLDPSKAVITYCHSGRRASFGYFVLRLMGFEDVILYEYSWNEWGKPSLYFPVQLAANRPAERTLPDVSTAGRAERSVQRERPEAPSDEESRSGYVSCGG